MTDLLLFLCYYGPVENTSGIRVGRLARAAVRAGCSALIVHGDARARRYEWQDGISVVTFRRTDPVAWRDRRQPQLSTRAATCTASRRPWISTLVRRAARTVLQPDEMVFSLAPFIKAGVSAGHMASGSSPWIAVVASAPAWTAFLAGRSVARRLQVPLILDFQDLWSSNPVAHWPPFAHQLARRWEGGVTRSAAAALFVNEGIAAHLTSHWPRLATVPHEVAPIAFETPVLPRIKVSPHADIRIGYFGSIYRGRSIGPLLEACAAARSPGCQPTVHWFGQLMGDHPDAGILARSVRQGILTLHDHLPYDEALVQMRACDLLVTIPAPVYHEELTTKLYDYLEVGRPILGLAPNESLLSHFLDSSQAGVCFAPGAVAAISQFLTRIAKDGLTLLPRKQVLEQHRLPAVSAAIARVLSGLGRSGADTMHEDAQPSPRR